MCGTFGSEHDIIFNPAKSQYVVFKPQRFHTIMPDVFLNDVSIPMVDNVKYLGIMLNEDLNDKGEILKQIGKLYARCNTVLRKFRKCSQEVKKALFTSFCTNIYSK